MLWMPEESAARESTTLRTNLPLALAYQSHTIGEPDGRPPGLASHGRSRLASPFQVFHIKIDRKITGHFRANCMKRARVFATISQAKKRRIRGAPSSSQTPPTHDRQSVPPAHHPPRVESRRAARRGIAPPTPQRISSARARSPSPRSSDSSRQ